MTDKALNKLLRTLEVPPAGESAPGKALDRALIALQNRATPQDEPVASKLWTRWLWIAGAVACVLVALLALPRGEKPDFAAQRRLLQQLEAEFPGQLDAVIERGNDIDLAISSSPSTHSDQPLVVTFRKSGRSIRVVSYSGREVCLTLGERKLCFEMLLTNEGEVIIAGRDFLWSCENRVIVAGYRISAAPLFRS